jgi:lysophospholipid acyltransferase (LPLAT)-like uncharacterized protein
MASKAKRYILTSKPFLSFIYRFIRTYSMLFFLKVENEKKWLDYVENGGTVLLCTWHQQFFGAIRDFQKYRRFNPSIMISQSLDGAIVSGIADKSGWKAVRGSSSRGGSSALKLMIENLKSSGLALHIADGPRGPAGKIKPGVIRMAHQADAVIVPFYVSADKAWYFNSWDKFMIPKPFSKVTLLFDEPVQLDKTEDKEIFEQQRQNLENMMLPHII